MSDPNGPADTAPADPPQDQQSPEPPQTRAPAPEGETPEGPPDETQQTPGDAGGTEPAPAPEPAAPEDELEHVELPPQEPRRPDDTRTEEPKGPMLVARYGRMRWLGEFRHRFDPPPAPGTNVVLRTDRGVELGRVVASVCDSPCAGCMTAEKVEHYVWASGPDYPFRRDGKALRIANPQDLIDQRHLESSARDERVFCIEQIRELALEMKLVTVEHLLGGDRIVFYFLAEHRVDFRELVRRLAGQYHTRIEMRQVGARDEARLVADYERCGQQCCCRSFLKDLKPISMRMAKTQKATLDPAKISGRCGRLMCCLRYEDNTYRELKAALPKKNTWVRTKELVGRVVGAHIITQLVQLRLPNESRAVVANEEIIERDVEPPAVHAPEAQRPRAKTTEGERAAPGATRPRRKPAPPPEKPREPAPDRTPAEQAEQIEPVEAPEEPEAAAEPVVLDPGWSQLLGAGVIDDTAPAAGAVTAAPAAEDTAPAEQVPVEDVAPAPEAPARDGPKKGGRGRRRGKRSPPGAAGSAGPGGAGASSRKRRRRRRRKKRSGGA